MGAYQRIQHLGNAVMNLSPRNRYWILVFTVFITASIFVGCDLGAPDGETETQTTSEVTDTKASCIFRSNPISDFGFIRSPVSVYSDQ